MFSTCETVCDDLLAKHDVPILASVAGNPDPAQVGIEPEALQQVLGQVKPEGRP